MKDITGFLMLAMSAACLVPTGVILACGACRAQPLQRENSRTITEPDGKKKPA